MLNEAEAYKTGINKLKFLIPVFVFAVTGSYAQTKTVTDSSIIRKNKVAIHYKIDFGWEFMMPTDKNRYIETATVNALAGVEFFKRLRLSLNAGITITYAYGSIIQWNENFKDTRYYNRAFGAGPVFLIRMEPVLGKGFSFSGDVGGGIILYSSRFPYGGDIYNFMWRLGGSLIYRVNSKYAFSVSGKWMHVSNGQGLGNFNPWYEAAGTSVQLVRYF